MCLTDVQSGVMHIVKSLRLDGILICQPDMLCTLSFMFDKKKHVLRANRTRRTISNCAHKYSPFQIIGAQW
jgi:hypothetical protein